MLFARRTLFFYLPSSRTHAEAELLDEGTKQASEPGHIASELPADQQKQNNQQQAEELPLSPPAEVPPPASGPAEVPTPASQPAVLTFGARGKKPKKAEGSGVQRGQKTGAKTAYEDRKAYAKAIRRLNKLYNVFKLSPGFPWNLKGSPSY